MSGTDSPLLRWIGVAGFALVAALGFIGWTATRSTHHPILHGTYESSDGKEWVEVSDRQIHFHLAVAGALTDRQFDYTVLSDGHIQPLGLTSNEAAYAFEWSWDGDAILRTTGPERSIQRFERRGRQTS